jgi:hypothetical protein
VTVGGGTTPTQVTVTEIVPATVAPDLNVRRPIEVSAPVTVWEIVCVPSAVKINMPPASVTVVDVAPRRIAAWS